MDMGRVGILGIVLPPACSFVLILILLLVRCFV